MNIIELCCCSGGMALGLRWAGLDVTTAFDWDSDACDSYWANHEHRPIQMDVRDVLRMIEHGWSPGSVDLIVADPPCTPWSNAGKRGGLADERDLLAVCCDIISRLRPRAWLIANVPGLDHARNESAVESTIGAIRGYCVHYTKLDAASFGVPQRRIRPFWYGHQADTPCIVWPSPTHADPADLRQATLPGVDPLRPWVTVREALGHLCEDELGRVKTVHLGRTGDDRPCDPDAPSRTLTTNNMGDGSLLSVGRHGHDPSSPDSLAKSVTASEAGNGGMTVEWPWDRPSTTVCEKSQVSAPGRNGRRGESQSHRCIVLSERARAILQGFPDEWVFAGATKRSRGAQIGMAMPPPMAHAVGRAIARCFGIESDEVQRWRTWFAPHEPAWADVEDIEAELGRQAPGSAAAARRASGGPNADS